MKTESYTTTILLDRTPEEALDSITNVERALAQTAEGVTP